MDRGAQVRLDKIIRELRRVTDRTYTNDERAARAAACVRDHNDEENVTDLLTDIRHYCDATGTGFVRCNNSSRTSHEAEVGESGLAKKIWD